MRRKTHRIKYEWVKWSITSIFGDHKNLDIMKIKFYITKDKPTI